MNDMAKVTIKGCLNTTPTEIETKKYNIYIGISLGNHYFTKNTVKAYVEWALLCTKEEVAVLIADEIHAINLEVLKGYSAEDARQSAEQAGDQTQNMLRSIINGLPEKQHSRIHVLRWKDVRQDSMYTKRLAIIHQAFCRNMAFQEKILSIVRNAFVGEVDITRLSQYVLQELPLFLTGLKHNGKRYTLLPYPGISEIDELVVGIQSRIMFPELADALMLTDKTEFIDALVE